jgi:hypothetical protein
MKRIVLLVTVALMMAVAGPVSATIHPLANSECANENASEVAKGQNPPGISDPSEGNFAQPVFSASGGEPFTTGSPAFKTPGGSVEELDRPFCPAPK